MLSRRCASPRVPHPCRRRPSLAGRGTTRPGRSPLKSKTSRSTSYQPGGNAGGNPYRKGFLATVDTAPPGPLRRSRWPLEESQGAFRPKGPPDFGPVALAESLSRLGHPGGRHDGKARNPCQSRPRLAGRGTTGRGGMPPEGGGSGIVPAQRNPWRRGLSRGEEHGEICGSLPGQMSSQTRLPNATVPPPRNCCGPQLIVPFSGA